MDGCDLMARNFSISTNSPVQSTATTGPLDPSEARSSNVEDSRNLRVSLAGADPTDVLRALLRTPKLEA